MYNKDLNTSNVNVNPEKLEEVITIGLNLNTSNVNVNLKTLTSLSLILLI